MKKLLFILSTIFLFSCSSEPKPFIPDFSTKEGKEDFARWAFSMSQNFVKNNLKSPSKADFPFLDYSWSDPDPKDNSIIIKSYVDSQNSFGATLRNDYYVKVRFKGGLVEDINNWVLIDLKFIPK